MAVRTELTPAEAADRLAIRELFDAYAHCADRRDADAQKALFTLDTRFAVYMDGEGTEPTYVLEGIATRRRHTSTDRARSRSTATALSARATRSPTTSSPQTAIARS
jgi:hypothetical protein